MEAELTLSYDKFVIDNEILGMCQRVLRGVEVNDETLATELMIKKGPAQDYVLEDHTLRHMRGEFYDPAVMPRGKAKKGEKEQCVVARAKAFVNDLRSKPAESRLDAAVRKEIIEAFPEILL